MNEKYVLTLLPSSRTGVPLRRIFFSSSRNAWRHLHGRGRDRFRSSNPGGKFFGSLEEFFAPQPGARGEWAIQSGNAEIVIAGEMELMCSAPDLLSQARNDSKNGSRSGRGEPFPNGYVHRESTLMTQSSATRKEPTVQEYLQAHESYSSQHQPGESAAGNRGQLARAAGARCWSIPRSTQVASWANGSA